MTLAVIGCTGFVGGTICSQADVAGTYNSQNIEDIRGRSFDTILCAGAPGAKWKANQQPDADLASILRLIESIRQARANRFVLISTVDVYPKPRMVDENSDVDVGALEPYGRHRYFLELSVRDLFPSATIIRLPGLFGIGLRKNFIYDLLNHNALHLTHSASTFQFYDMGNLWSDIQLALACRLPLVNFAAEPVKAGDVARRCFGLEFSNEPGSPPVHYDMRTRLAGAFRARNTLSAFDGPYLQSAEYTFKQIRELAVSSRALGAA